MVALPLPDQAILDRRAEIVAALRQIVPGEGVIESPERLRVYESDGLTAYRQTPLVAVLPETVEQVSSILRYAYDNGIKVVPRGAGTSLSGGALPLGDGILLGMAKFNRILEIDWDNRCVVAQPGVRLTSKKILESLKPQLAGFKLPKFVYIVADLPRNAMGKVQKNVLREQYGK